MPAWLEQLLPILILLVVVAAVVARLPKVQLGHSPAFLRRRLANWLPVGLAYSFLYFGRYNLNAFKGAVGMSNDAFGTIDFWGALTYGISFVINGPLADRFGGRATLIAAVAGSAAVNLAMGVMAEGGWKPEQVNTYAFLYALNMYFQSFGAVSIVKINASWFHLRERGTFGGIFGILISMGLYFAYDWGSIIAKNLPTPNVFYIPAVTLVIMLVWVLAMARNTPGETGHPDFDTGDAGSGDTGPRKGVLEVAALMMRNPVIITITAIEFCSGYLRNAVMKWHPVYAKSTGITDQFVPSNWGMLLCCAGILGGMFAGTISDALFQSRRGPVAVILYSGMLFGAGVVYLTTGSPILSWTVVFMSLCVIGVHGMLSGTASMDFGGKRNVGLVVGIIDGFVYLGVAAQAWVLKGVLPDGDAAKDPANWWTWAPAMAPVAAIGLLLSMRVWSARATRSTAH